MAEGLCVEPRALVVAVHGALAEPRASGIESLRVGTPGGRFQVLWDSRSAVAVRRCGRVGRCIGEALIAKTIPVVAAERNRAMVE